MRLLADTNTFLTVALEAPEKAQLIAKSEGADLLAPSVLPYEIGNALSALVKRRRLQQDQAMQAWDATQRIPVELVEIDITSALRISSRFDIYAYDAYFLQAALEWDCPLLTLDKGMQRVAREMSLRLAD